MVTRVGLSRSALRATTLSNLRLARVIKPCNWLSNFPSLPLAVERDDQRSDVGERPTRTAIKALYAANSGGSADLSEMHQRSN
jgi:hypothetical protein